MGNTWSTVTRVYGINEQQPVENEDWTIPKEIYNDLSPNNYREDISLLLAVCSKVYNGFTRSSPYEELRSQMLGETIGMTVIGNTGDGKTTAVKALAWELYLSKGFLPVEARSIQEIKELYEADKNLLFLVDDPFGAYRVYWDFVKDWAVRLGELDKYIVRGNFKIIITTRTSIWQECKFDLKRVAPFDGVLDMSSSRLTEQDRAAILKNYLSLKNIDINTWEWKWKIERIAHMGTTLGFPLCCKLACEREEELNDIVSFFEEPIDFMREELRRVAANRPHLYSALALLMLNDGSYSLRDLDPCQPLSADLVMKSREILRICGIDSRNAIPSVSQVRNTLEKLNGTFLQKNADGYTFSHKSLLLAVALELGQVSPEVLLKYAHPQIVIKTFQACREFEAESSNIIALRQDLYPQFAAVITTELLKGSVELAFSNQSWLEDKFYKIWEGHVLSENNVDDFLFPTGRRWQRTILHYAAHKGVLRMVKFLTTHLQEDASALRDDDGITVLHSAANGGHASVVDYLLKQGFDPNVQENAGWTPLYVAVLCGHAPVVSLLLLGGADPNICTIYGSSPLYAAALCEHWDLASILRSWGARSIEEHNSPSRTEFDLLSLLFEQDDSPVATLLRAVRTGQVGEVNNLLDYGMDVNDANACGWSSLYVSAVCGRGDIASLLLHRGADPRQATIYGRTPSYVAKVCGHTDIVKMIDFFERDISAF